MLQAFDLLFLPLLGGFLFINICNATSYSAKRHDGYRLVFFAALAGAVSLAVARILAIVTAPESRSLSLLIGAVIGAGLCFTFSIAAHAFRSMHKSEIGTIRFLSEIAAFVLIATGTIATTAWVPINWKAGVVAFALITAIYVAYIKIRTISDIKPSLILLRMSGYSFLVAVSVGFASLFFARITELWARVSNLQGFGVATLALLIGPLTAYLINSIYSRRAAMNHLVFASPGSSIEAFLAHAAENQTMIQVTLLNEQAYVGYIKEIPPNPNEENAAFSIVPTLSGHRDKEGKLDFSVNYEKTFAHFKAKNPKAALNREVLAKVIPINQIRSVNLFDLDLYEEFNRP